MFSQKNCLVILVLVICVISCQKEQVKPQDRLLAFRDANRYYSLKYDGSQVKAIHVDSGLGAPFIISTYEYSHNYIKAKLHASTGYDYVEYFMRKNVLPLAILKHKNINGRDTVVSRTDFYYKNGSDAIDSVVLKNSVKLNFIPVYSGGNITDYYLSQDNKQPVIAGSFLYYPLVNVFKTTNSLLFVYSSPVFEFETFLMPRIFSSQTMKKFNGGSFIYDTDAKGNLSLEDYGPMVYPYRRTYTYE
jgi:hypothetical protein